MGVSQVCWPPLQQQTTTTARWACCHWTPLEVRPGLREVDLFVREAGAAVHWYIVIYAARCTLCHVNHDAPSFRPHCWDVHSRTQGRQWSAHKKLASCLHWCTHREIVVHDALFNFLPSRRLPFCSTAFTCSQSNDNKGVPQLAN